MVLSIGLALRAVGIGVPGNKIASAVVNIVLTAGIFAAFWGLGVEFRLAGVRHRDRVPGPCGGRLSDRAGLSGALAAQAQVAAAVGLGSSRPGRSSRPRSSRGALGGGARSPLPAAHARVRMRYLDIKRYSPEVR